MRLKLNHLLSDGARHVGHLVSMLTSYEVFMRVYKDTSKMNNLLNDGARLVFTRSLWWSCARGCM